VEKICELQVNIQSNPRPSDLKGHMAGFHVFEEEKKDLRFEKPEGRIHGGDPGHRFKGIGGNISSTLGDCHTEENGV
jgi:hypothetical protein